MVAVGLGIASSSVARERLEQHDAVKELGIPPPKPPPGLPPPRLPSGLPWPIGGRCPFILSCCSPSISVLNFLFNFVTFLACFSSSFRSLTIFSVICSCVILTLLGLIVRDSCPSGCFSCAIAEPENSIKPSNIIIPFLIVV